MNEKILIVDDDVAMVDNMKMFIEFRTIPVATATSVSNVKRLLNEEEISLICTDWDLGDGTGLDVLQFASEKNIPVVFFTGHDEDSYKEKAMSLGGARYYIKGVDSCEDIIDDLITFLERQSF